MPPEGSASGLGRLKRRPEFLAVAGARRKWVAPGLILQARRHDERQHSGAGEPSTRVGFTASKKVGNAVARNRAKRRLRAIAQEILAVHGAAGHDFVLIARGGTLDRDYADLKQDLTACLKRLGVWRTQPEAVDP
jgi:ribonuclease P protein component